MGKSKKYIKKSADGRFFLFVEKPEYQINPENKTKLWISSDYLFNESLKENKDETINTLNYLISWNESQENFENCSILLEYRKKI
jgi:hypothetical protein